MVEDEARRVRAIGPDQVIRTIAGGGKLPPVDGLLATEIDISPQGIAFDPAGNLHISDGVRVLRVDFDRRITVVAGSGATFCPDDAGRASLACISPFDIAFDAAGNLYIADYSADSSRGNSPGGLIRKVLAIPPAFPAGRLPLELTLSSPSGGAAVRATTLVEAAIPGMSFSATAVSDGDWLKVSPGSGNSPRNLEIAANPASLSPRPAPYEGVVIISVPNALPPARLIRVSLQVGNPLPSQLKVDVPIISFVYPAGASARSESVTISNAGGGNVSFTVRPEEGAGWLTVTPGSGVARPGQPVELSLMADPSGLRGTRRAHLIVEGESGERIEVPIIMAISRLGKAFVLTQKALSFRAIEGGGIIPPQTFGVASLGVEPIAWAVQTKYQNGAGWLKAAAVRTVSTRTETVPEVTVEVDPSGLKPGTYFAVIEVRGASAGVVNSPQALPIFLEVMPATSTLPSAVEPGELTFTAIRGVPPSSKDVFVYNVGSDIRSVSIRASADSAENWLANLPADAVLDKTRRMRVIVQPQFVNAAGKFQGHLTLRFSDGNVREVPVTLIVEEPPATTGRNATASCTPNELVTAVRVQGGTLSVAPGDWVTMEAAVSDNCNQPLIDGVVQLTFANGDPPQPLISMGDGRWQGGWRPSSTLSGFVVEGRSHNGIRGRRDVSLRLLGRVEKPSFTKESIVSLESQRPGDPVAPGSIIVIRGEGLAEKSEEKLPTDWTTDAVGGTRVILGDKPMAMWRASSTELAGQVPFDIAPDAPWTIYVTKGLVLSSAVRVDVAAAWPVITAQLENSGDNFVLRCTGLGPAEAGEDSKTRYAVTVKVDGQPVGQVTATYAKHSYQVAFQLPPGVNGGTAIVSVDTGDQVLSSDPFPLQTRPE